MTIEELMLRRTVASASGVLYWAGVVVQARRVRKKIGRSPNVKPKGTKEKLLWLGWFLVILSWTVQPWFAEPQESIPFALADGWEWAGTGLAAGIFLVIAGYAGTLWCYAAMKETWRMGINRKETTRLVTLGPYRCVRHPIYALQLVMLLGVLLLIPTAVTLAALLLHVVCVRIKLADEEKYLLSVHGDYYRGYCNRTGALIPRLLRPRGGN